MSKKLFRKKGMKIVTSKKIGPEENHIFDVTVSFDSIYSQKETAYLKDFLDDCFITEESQLDQAIENYFSFWSSGINSKYKTQEK
jgi:hypothetical protein